MVTLATSNHGSVTNTTNVQRLLVRQIAPETDPEMRQPRMLPRPDELIIDGTPVPAYVDLVAELEQLGESLRERQLQPIVVYPGHSAEFPEADYIILVGHRRWTAAVLVGLEALDALVIDRPEPAERLRLQYVENEDREEFSDIERMWALLKLKQAMNDAPWEQIEGQLKIGRSRRQQLTRLGIFNEAQQRKIALLRLQETQLRPLHAAARKGELNPTQVDQILDRLLELAAERAAEEWRSGTQRGLNVTTRRTYIDGPTVARLVAQALKAASTRGIPRWVDTTRERLGQLRRTAQRLREADILDNETENALLSDLEQLADELSSAVAERRRRQVQLVEEE